MPAIRRWQDAPYEWDIIEAPLKDVANVEKFMPRDFITEDGFHITQACRDYLSPLIQGEDFPPFKNGMPHYVTLKRQTVAKKLPPFTV